MNLKFRDQLLLIFSGVIALALISATWFSWQAANLTIRSNAEGNLRVAESVFGELMANDYHQLRERVSILAADFGFRRAIATGEQDTVISVLANHGERVDADLMFLLDPEGLIVESTHALQDADFLRDLLGGEGTRLIVAEGDVFQVVMVPVRAPDLIGWVGMGFVIDRTIAELLKRLTGTEVSFVFDIGENRVRTLSTISDLSGKTSWGLWPAISALMEHLEDSDMLSRRFEMPEINGEGLHVVLSSSLSEALADWASWRRQLWLIASAALLLTAITAWFVARSVSRPIHALMGVAARIAGGDYRQHVSLAAGNEFDVLADTFNDMQTAIREREQQVLHQARHNDLTGFPTREYLGELIAQSELPDQDTPRYALILMRVIKLQQLAEAYGVEWCDELLAQIGQRLKNHLRDGDLAGHIGRDQFIVYSPSADVTAARHLVAHLATSMKSVFLCRSIEVTVDIHMGVALCPEHADNYDDLLRRASIALSLAGIGVEGASFYESGQDLQHLRKIRVTQRLQRAIHGTGLELHYQPKFDLHKNQITQVEALLRWTDDELGRVFPDEFIPLAESSGDILALSTWVLKEAAATLRQWLDQGITLQIGVNISARDFLQPDFVDRTMQVLREAGIKPSNLVLEVTESAAIDDVERTIEHLLELRELGFGLSMDDFGTGYSSLSQLKRLPLYELKIDKSFVLKLDSEDDDKLIVRSTIELGHNMGMRVVAEGVENQASLTMLRELGCDAVQGYYLSRPLPRDQFEHFWREHDANVAHMLPTAPAQGAS